MKKALSLVLALVMVLTLVPFAFAGNIKDVEWKGAMNYNDGNNAVFSLGEKTPTESDFTKEAWAVKVNTTNSSWGVYAGQTAIADDMLYITGTDGLLKIDTATGEIKDTLAGVGSTQFFYDYLIIDGDNALLFIVQSNEIQVVDLKNFSLVGDYATKSEFGISSLGSYHPAQLHDGYLICNGYSFKVNAKPNENEKYLTAVNTVTFGTVDKLKKNFAWSSGVFIGDLFYVTCTDTAKSSETYNHVLVLAVDYKTAEVKHTFDAGLASDYTLEAQKGYAITRYNTTGQAVYDNASGYLYWSNRYSTYLFGVKLNGDGSFASELKTALLSKNTGTVCAPVIANGRLYIAGQGEGWGQGGDICVVNVDVNSPDFMKEIYSTNSGLYKIQSNPLVFTEGDTSYVLVQSYVAPGYLYMLTDTPATASADMKLLATPSKGKAVALDAGSGSGGAYAYEQLATDNEGRIYAYNEEGYLFCFEKSDIAIPEITKNLSTDRVKYELNAQAETLSIEATLNGKSGTLSYQWQSSDDKNTWTDIDGATDTSYTPSTADENTKYYRVSVTNTDNAKTATVNSDSAWVLTKAYSDNTNIKVVSSTSNSITSNGTQIEPTGDFFVVTDVKAPRVWVAPEYNEATIEKLDVINGTEPAWANPTGSNKFNDTTYIGRAYFKTTPDASVIPIKVTAENGDTATKYILVGTTDGLKNVKYAAELSEIEDKELNINDMLKLDYEVTKYVGSADEETYSAVTWTSDNEEILSVDNGGNITALKPGTATVTVTHGLVSTSCKVTVKSPITSISLDKDTLNLTEGDTAELTLTVTPDDTTDDKTATWTSSDETVVTVDNGKVTALKEGETTIAVKLGDFTAECKVIVTRKAQENTVPTADNNNKNENTNTTDNNSNNGSKTVNKTTEKHSNSPKMGGEDYINLFVVIAVMSSTVIAFYIVKNRRKKNCR